MCPSKCHEVGSPSGEARRAAREAGFLRDDRGREGARQTSRSRDHAVGPVRERGDVLVPRHVLLAQPQEFLDGEGRARVQGGAVVGRHPDGGRHPERAGRHAQPSVCCCRCHGRVSQVHVVRPSVKPSALSCPVFPTVNVP